MCTLLVTAGKLLVAATQTTQVFVFLVIFRSFEVPREQQHIGLNWGVTFALAMRYVPKVRAQQKTKKLSPRLYLTDAELLFGRYSQASHMSKEKVEQQNLRKPPRYYY